MLYQNNNQQITRKSIMADFNKIKADDEARSAFNEFSVRGFENLEWAKRRQIFKWIVESALKEQNLTLLQNVLNFLVVNNSNALQAYLSLELPRSERAWQTLELLHKVAPTVALNFFEIESQKWGSDKMAFIVKNAFNAKSLPALKFSQAEIPTEGNNEPEPKELRSHLLEYDAQFAYQFLKLNEKNEKTVSAEKTKSSFNINNHTINQTAQQRNEWNKLPWYKKLFKGVQNLFGGLWSNSESSETSRPVAGPASIKPQQNSNATLEPSANSTHDVVSLLSGLTEFNSYEGGLTHEKEVKQRPWKAPTVGKPPHTLPKPDLDISPEEGKNNDKSEGHPTQANPDLQSAASTPSGLGKDSVASTPIDLGKQSAASTPLGLGKDSVASTPIDLGKQATAKTVLLPLPEFDFESQKSEKVVEEDPSTPSGLGSKAELQPDGTPKKQKQNQDSSAASTPSGLGKDSVASTPIDLGKQSAASTPSELGKGSVASTPEGIGNPESIPGKPEFNSTSGPTFNFFATFEGKEFAISTRNSELAKNIVAQKLFSEFEKKQSEQGMLSPNDIDTEGLGTARKLVF